MTPGLIGPCACRRTPVDPQKREDPARPPAFVNDNSHWWDGSQVYGSTREVQARLRLGRAGKMKVRDDGRLLVDPATGFDVTGVTDNGWVGLSLLHGIFAQEHNAICDRLARDFAAWDDERLFQQARLVNAALMAKIHTVEWTPAIVPHPLTQLALQTNWSGIKPNLQRVFRGLNDVDLLSGIPGSPTDHHSAPYSLTEEFAAVVPHAFAAARRLRCPFGEGRPRARAIRVAGAGRPERAARCWTGSILPTCGTRWALRIPARCACTTFPSTSRISGMMPASASIWRPSTFCAIGNGRPAVQPVPAALP
jgi:hypothetical protein